MQIYGVPKLHDGLAGLQLSGLADIYEGWPEKVG